MSPAPPRLAGWLISIAARPANRRPVLHDLREEFDAMLAEGVPLGEARRWYWRQALASVVPLIAARRGGVAGLAGTFRSEGGARQDLRVGLRTLVNRPAFSLIVVGTLALGIGATSAVFSLIQGVLLTPPAYQEPGRLSLLTPKLVDGRETMPRGWSGEQWLGWREESQLFESIAAYTWGFNFLVSEEGSESLEGMRVTHNYFGAVGLEPMIGRTFDVTDTPGSVVVLGHDLWMRQFEGDPGVLGQPLRVSRVPTPPVIIGVMPPGVRFLPYRGAAREPNYDVNAMVDYWWSAEISRASDPDVQARRGWSVVGRLRPGVTRAAAETELDVLTAQQAAEDPRYEGVGVEVRSVVEVFNHDGRRILLPLLAAAALVLLIACGNAAAMLLVRGLQRQQELGIRGALGGGRIALIRLVTMESLVLAGLGGSLGVVLAFGMVRGFKTVAGHAVPRLDAVTTGWPVILFGLALALVATVVAGLYPALRASRDTAAGAMKPSGSRATASRAERRFLAGMTMMQAALTLTLIIGAGLLIRTMSNLTTVDAGFESDRVLTMSVTEVSGNWDAFHARALEEVSSLPGVRGAAFAWGVPLTGNNWPFALRIEGRESPDGSQEPLSLPARSVTPGYFAVLGQAVVEGRDFRSTDTQGAPSVALVNQSFVDRYLGGNNAVGRRLILRPTDPPAEIVGVVSNTRTDDLTLAAEPEVYFSLWQLRAFSKHLVVRSVADPTGVVVEVQRTLRAIAPTVAVENIKTLDDIQRDSLASQTFAMRLLIVFAAVACVLTLGGIYGMLSLSVASRRREIAIRTAVGAGRRTVLGMVLREGMLVVMVGVTVGLVASVALSRILGSFLFAVRPTDPVTMAAGAALFALVAVVACWLPARRAVAVDPVTALREE